MATDNNMKAVDYALTLIQDKQVIGLGSGRAATEFLKGLAQKTREGLVIQGVPTSNETEKVARRLKIPLTTLDAVKTLDLAVDGADEVDPALNLIKGKGGALVREKIVAAASEKLVIIVGPEKLVPVLGSHGVLPVEIIPFAQALCRRELNKLGCSPKLRMTNSKPFVSDNGNYILDCEVKALRNPQDLEDHLRTIPGVVGTGLFLEMADVVLVQHPDRLEVRRRKRGQGR